MDYNSTQVGEPGDPDVNNILLLSGFSIVLFFLCKKYTSSNDVRTRNKPKKIKLKMVKYSSIKDEIENTECCICLDTLNSNKYLTVLSCNHVFHYTCLKRWHETKTTCPICRENIV